MQEQYVIIVAGGIGSRMKSDLPKQFIELDGVPVIIRTIHRFLEFDPAIRIVISIHKDYRRHLEEIIAKFNLAHANIQITYGGESRFDSVKNGLSMISNNEAIVGIHDAARPFVSLRTISECYATAKIRGSAIPCITVNESLRMINSSGNYAVNRSEYRIIQTPQCFPVASIKKAFEQDHSPAFTDDATVLESTGEKITLVEGNEENIKITSPHDLLLAKALLTR